MTHQKINMGLIRSFTPWRVLKAIQEWHRHAGDCPLRRGALIFEEDVTFEEAVNHAIRNLQDEGIVEGGSNENEQA